jgi:Family of unknown function (DUF6338)
MSIWEADKLILFIAFVIPGFISIKTYELLCPGIQRDSSKQIVDAVAYSCVNYALLIWPIMAVEASGWKNGNPNLYAAFYMFALLGSPVTLSLMLKFIRTRQFFQRAVAHPTQKPWDYVFSKRESYWIKIALKDGTKLGGIYAGKSFASSAPADEQIYLEESWIVNDKGGLDRPKSRTAGVLVTSSEISYIELMKYEEGSHSE